jgi:hypothetical protein
MVVKGQRWVVLAMRRRSFECADSLGGREASEILRFAQDDNALFAGDERGGTGAASGGSECADSLGERDASEILRFAQDGKTLFCG